MLNLEPRTQSDVHLAPIRHISAAIRMSRLSCPKPGKVTEEAALGSLPPVKIRRQHRDRHGFFCSCRAVALWEKGHHARSFLSEVWCEPAGWGVRVWTETGWPPEKDTSLGKTALGFLGKTDNNAGRCKHMVYGVSNTTSTENAMSVKDPTTLPRVVGVP